NWYVAGEGIDRDRNLVQGRDASELVPGAILDHGGAIQAPLTEMLDVRTPVKAAPRPEHRDNCQSHPTNDCEHQRYSSYHRRLHTGATRHHPCLAESTHARRRTTDDRTAKVELSCSEEGSSP